MSVLTPRQLADRAGLSVGTIYGLVSKGLLPCYRVGVKRGKILIKWEDWVAHLEQHRVSEWPNSEEKPKPVPKSVFKHLNV